MQFFSLRSLDTAELIKKKKSIPTFYKKCIIFFQELCRKSMVIKEDENEIIWVNNAFKFNGTPLYFNHWSKVGITHISDIMKNGELDEYGIYKNYYIKLLPFLIFIKLKLHYPILGRIEHHKKRIIQPLRICYIRYLTFLELAEKH